MSTISDLLALELPAPKTETLRVPRLKLPNGEPLTLTLKQLTYSRVAELKKLERDFEVHVVLAGVAEPNFRAPEVLEHCSVETPAMLVKKLFLPGEIDEISGRIERLSGYRRRMTELVEEAAKN